MKTKSKVLSSFFAAAIWVDGEYDEFEKEFVGELDELLEVKTISSDLAKEIKATEKMTEDEKRFALVKRDLSDFKRGLAVPGKLLPKKINGGVVLVDTNYELR